MPASAQGTSQVRLAELVATLSLGTDLGLGQPMEHVLRQSLIALRLAERLGCGEQQRAVVYYSGLLAWVGCHVDAYEQARWFGDDIALKAGFRRVDGPGPRFMMSRLASGRPLLERARVGIAFLGDGRRAARGMLDNHCYATDQMAARLGLGDEVRASLVQSFERWDGRGVPEGRRGGEILLSSRLINLADVVEVVHRADGMAAAVAVARERSGSQFDPALVEIFCEQAPALFADLDAVTCWEAVIAAEPALGARLGDAELDSALQAIGDFTDVKSPYTIGHSRAVAGLAAEAARGCRLPEGDVVAIRRAALAHDIGLLGVSNAILDKRSALTSAETERLRMHPYLSERMLACSAALAPLGAIAAQHHERLDGSGYPRGLSGAAISASGRILAAADAYQARTEPRPTRPALSPAGAASETRADVVAGRLDGDAVDAVLRAAGHRVRRRRDWPAGLTPREVEVLRLVARGLSNKQIAAQLVISRKTAANHVEHIYTKIGVRNRARASLFAVRHGLMTEA